jgi:4,5-dihydroxyphthalate decarboxylase
MPSQITLALDRYDRHMPIFLGQLNLPSDLELLPLEVGMAPPRRHGVDRHRRMLHGKEFDAAEVSLASYIISKSRGAPFSAIPVFPRRLFSQNHIFVKAGSPYHHPRDLKGKRIIVWAFQVTMSVLAKADMREHYDLDWRDVEWLTQHREEVEVDNLPIRQLHSGADPIEMLLDGEAAAFIHPHPPHKALSGQDGIRRLFDNVADECERYFAKCGYLPIMHLIAMQDKVIVDHPDLPTSLMKLWESSKEIADDFYHDPGYGLPALARLTYERQKGRLGPDIWPSGLAANRANIEWFINAMVDQRLIDEPISVERLFHPSVLGT